MVLISVHTRNCGYYIKDFEISQQNFSCINHIFSQYKVCSLTTITIDNRETVYSLQTNITHRLDEDENFQLDWPHFSAIYGSQHNRNRN